MRIVTRPDFDGIVCAVIILEAHQKELQIVWIEPSEVQNGKADIKNGDIMANLPFDERCSVWFDHHVSNSAKFDKYFAKNNSKENGSNSEDKFNSEKEIYQGAFKIAPSAAGVVYQYYKENGQLSGNFDELIKETDIIDAAMLSMDQVLYPEKHPFILLSMTVKNRDDSDKIYWNKLVKLLRQKSIDEILVDREVKKRCEQVVNENILYADILKQYTKINGNISITDFRALNPAPSGNRFLTYSLFPDSIANIKMRYDDHDKGIVFVSIGKSIFRDEFNINIGKLLAKYGGGGHAGAGGCSMKASEVDKNIDEIAQIMVSN